MKNILFIADCFLAGGMETRILGQIQEYKKNHLNSFLLCESFNSKHSPNFCGVLDKVSFMPKNGKFLVSDILSAKNKIVKYCKTNKIDFIDCQPFWCVLPAVLAAEECHIPISFTIHGLASGNFIDKQCLAAKTIYDLALSYGVDILFAVAEYLQDGFLYIPQNIQISRNGTDISRVNIKKRNNGRFAIASRLDIPKTKIILDFLPILLELDFVKSIDIYGDGECKNLIKKFIEDNKTDKIINLVGWVDNLSSTLKEKEYDAVFGMGRVILDSISANTPAGILGYGGFAGFITKASLEYFLKTNLTSWECFKKDEIKDKLSALYDKKTDFSLDKKIINQLDNHFIWQNHLNLCQNVKQNSKPIIKALTDLLAKNQRINLLNDTILLDKLLKIIIEYNCVLEPILLKIISDENKKLLTQNQEYQTQINDLKQSNSWKITKPLRIISEKFKNNSPEIIAAICTFNESLNIDKCLNHLENFVDKIILFDDNSNDNTINIAKKHKKVVKIIQNPNKTHWAERKNREIILKAAYNISQKKNPWVLCVDADERFETNFLKNLRKLASENPEKIFSVHFRELWDDVNHYRNDGIWDDKRKSIFFPLRKKMTFNYQNEHHIPWAYRELENAEIVTDYNLYHLKMIKPVDRKKRMNLYNQLDPNKIMQPIGYDYLIDEKNLMLKKVPKEHSFDTKSIPKYYL